MVAIAALVLLSLCMASSQTAAAAETRNVLVLYSNSRLLPANLAAEQGLRETLVSTPERRVELYAEFLDVPRFGGDAYSRTIATYLREKYREHPPDVVVAAGDAALDFMLQDRARLFSGVPLVHLGVSRTYLSTVPPLPDDVVGVPIGYDSLGSIEQALRWHPSANRLVVVTGTNAFDRSWQERLAGELAVFGDRATVEFLTGLPTDDLLQRLRALPRNTVVFTPGYFEDGTGRIFTPREAVEIIASASVAPVYGPYDTFIGTGIVGGRMPSYAGMGRQGAQIVNALFDGVTLASLDLPDVGPMQVHLDWRQARRFGIRESDVGADTIVHFKEPTFWEAYRNEALFVAAVISLQGALIAALLVERRRRRWTNSALEVSERRMSLATRAGGLSLWTWDASRKDPGGAFDRVHPADRAELERAAREALAKDEDLNVEYRVLESDGGVRWIAAHGRAEKGRTDRLLGVARDFTERRDAELQAERDRTALRHLARVSMLGQLSASIAHQLNQPLAAILGNAEAARTMLAREPIDLVELREICDDIVTEDHRAAEVIRRLGALFKHGELRLSPLDMNELVSETLELARTDLLLRHVTPVVGLASSLPAINGDRVQLQQVLLNLIVNAADAMSDTREAERVLTIRTDVAGSNVRVSVADCGPGVATEHLKTVFEPFWTTKSSGMGIGLAICRSIAAAHRGSLTAANRAEGGAEFCVTLPLGSAA